MLCHGRAHADKTAGVRRDLSRIVGVIVLGWELAIHKFFCIEIGLEHNDLTFEYWYQFIEVAADVGLVLLAEIKVRNIIAKVDRARGVGKPGGCNARQ